MAQTHNFDVSAIPTDKFSYNKGQFIAEMSDFGPCGLRWYPIYPDACDEGIALVGKTGKVVIYYLNEVRRDADGDIQSWEFKPISEHARKWPEVAQTHITIFND